MDTPQTPRLDLKPAGLTQGARLLGQRLKFGAWYYAVGLRRTVRRYTWDALAVAGGASTDHDCLLLDKERGVSFTALAERIEQVRRGARQSPGTFVVRFGGPVVVEPRYGWAISHRASLEDLSLTYGWETHSWGGREWLGLPSPANVLAARLSRRKLRELPGAISLISPWPENYFHFLTDVLPKLIAFEDAGVPDTLPILVSGELASRRFFQEAFERGALERREIIPIGSDAVVIHELYAAHGPPLDTDSTERLLSLLGHEPAAPEPGNRIFVTRASHRGRTIENFAELSPAISAAGFRIVDLDDVSFHEQARMFSSLEMLAGIHGAGLVNMVFSCGRPLPVLEILPHGMDTEMDYFRQMSKALGYRFSRIHGEPCPFIHKRANFRVDPERFQRALSNFVAEHEQGRVSIRP